MYAALKVLLILFLGGILLRFIFRSYYAEKRRHLKEMLKGAMNTKFEDKERKL